MKKEWFLLIGACLLLLALASFAEFPLQPLPGRTCWHWQLNEIESKRLYPNGSAAYWLASNWKQFATQDRIDFIVTQDATQAQVILPDGMKLYAIAPSRNYICPKGTAGTCGYFDCADIYLGNYDKPVFRLELDNFVSGKTVDLALSGYKIDDTATVSEKFELNDVLNDYVQHLLVVNLKNIMRFGISGDEQADKALDPEWVGITVFDPDLIALLQTGVIGTEMYIAKIEQGTDSNTFKKSDVKYFTLKSDADLKLTLKNLSKDKTVLILLGECPATAPTAEPANTLYWGIAQQQEETKTVPVAKLNMKNEAVAVKVCHYLDSGKVEDSIKILPKGAAIGPSEVCATIVECLAKIDKKFVEGIFGTK